MRNEGGLSVVQAPMGGGKSLYEVRHGVSHMLAGGWWVTNIQLGVFEKGVFVPFDERWARKVARRVAPLSRRKQARVVSNLLERYRYTDELEHALRHSVHRSLRRPGKSLARLGWDESFADLNARRFMEEERQQLFERVPMLRKNGVDGYLLAQHADLIDVNARRILNWDIEVLNQRENARIRGLRLRFLPTLFLAYWYSGRTADRSAVMSRRRPKYVERYFRSWHCNIYDTLGLYGVSASDAASDNTIWLGGSDLEGGGGGKPAPQAGPAAASVRPLPARGR